MMEVLRVQGALLSRPTRGAAAERRARRAGVSSSASRAAAQLRQTCQVTSLMRPAQRGRLATVFAASSASKSPDSSEDHSIDILSSAVPANLSPEPATGWERNPLKEFGKLPLDLVVFGTVWALFLSELLRFCCEVPAPLPTKIIAVAMIAFCFNGGMLTGKQISSARASEAGGQPAGTYRMWTYVKAVGYLSGMVLAVVKLLPAAGMCLFFSANVLFLTLNTQNLSRGDIPSVVNLAPPARKVFRNIALIDTALLILSVGSWQLLERGFEMPATVLAGLVAAFAAYQCFQIHVKRKAM